MKRKEVASLLKTETAYRMLKKRHAVTFELGVCKRGRLRADVLAMSGKGEFTIFEIKSCVADFTSDSKCHKYLKYCNKFYFVFTAATWDKLKDRVSFPPPVGVITWSDSDGLRVVRNSRRQEMSAKVKTALLMRLAYRASDATSISDLHKITRR